MSGKPRSHRSTFGLLAALACACVLILPAGAGAAVTRLAGDIEPKGSVWFNVQKFKRADGKRIVRITNFHFRKLPLTCKGDAESITSFLTLKPRVRNNEFEQVAVARDAGGKTIARLTIKGELRKRGTKASGTIRVAGDKVPVDSGGNRKCTSGRLSWTAKA